LNGRNAFWTVKSVPLEGRIEVLPGNLAQWDGLARE
jgi:hypothetical protein